MKQPKLQHFLSIDQLDAHTLLSLLDHAQQFVPAVKNESVLTHLSGKVIAPLFFEHSTRTRCSFELAAKRLNAIVLNPELKHSSLNKGETLLDTLLNLETMGVRGFIIRHSQEALLKSWVPQMHARTHLINAGDGAHQHPTQTLLDLLTIRQHKASFKSLRIALIGDITHSRVAQSLLQGLSLLGTPDIRLIGPEALLPKETQNSYIRSFNSMREGLDKVDVIVALRLQKERIDTPLLTEFEVLRQEYCLNSERLQYADPAAIVMHPGPLNRGDEITSEVADGPQSVILQQVSNGVAVRMAVLDYLFKDS